MDNKEAFEFLNSPFWIKYTHQQYRDPDEIYYRIKGNSEIVSNWERYKKRMLVSRKTNAIPLFLNSINKKFWFYPSDCINQKADELEKRGIQLHDRIIQNPSFRNEFFLDSLIEEAITSAIYEGANSTRAKAQELIASGIKPKNKDEWMLINNYEAMKWIKAHKAQDISLDLLKEIHSIVTKNTLEGDDANFSGQFRNDRVFVHSSFNELKHEGVNFSVINNALDESMELTSKNTRYFPAVIKGILLHYFTAYIHPFFDGNGRTARALFYFKAMKNNLDFVELLSISAYLKNHGRSYEKAFEKVVNNDLDITYFIDFNLDALLNAIVAVEKKVDYLISLNQLSKKFPITNNQTGLLQRLVLHKFRKVSIEEYAESIDMSREIARQELKQLCDWKLMNEEKVGKKFVYQVAREEISKHIKP